MIISRLSLSCLLVAVIMPAALASCDWLHQKKPVPGVYCDGTSQWRCTDPSYPVCDLPENRCVAGTGDLGACVRSGTCTINGDMSGEMGPHCPCDMSHPDLMPMCTVSNVAADCTNAAQPICDGTSQTCRACSSSSDNAQCAAHGNGKNVCNPTSGQCVECASNADCMSASKPVCDTTTNTCRGCVANAECSTKICTYSTGECVPSTMIALVDHGGVGVTACQAARTGAGAQTGNDAAHAYCDIGGSNPTNALATDARPYILVTGYGTGSMAYSNIQPSRSVTIVGPGGTVTASSRAVILGSASAPAVGIFSKQTVTLDGLELTGGAIGNQGINCGQTGATLIVMNSLIDNNNGPGILSTGCTLNIDSTNIAANAGGGLSISTADFVIQNSVVAGNGTGTSSGSNFGGILVSGSGTTNKAQIINVTVADNSAKSSGTVYSQLDCASGAAPLIFNTVVANNNINTNLVNPACESMTSCSGGACFAYSSLPGGTGTNHDISGCTDTQLFISSGANPYQPLPSAVPRCNLVGKGTSSYMSVPAPGHDLTGATRPSPPSDGAYE